MVSAEQKQGRLEKDEPSYRSCLLLDSIHFIILLNTFNFQSSVKLKRYILLAYFLQNSSFKMKKKFFLNSNKSEKNFT